MEVTVTKISGSLVVQWLRVCASNAEHQGSIPGQGHAATKTQYS